MQRWCRCGQGWLRRGTTVPVRLFAAISVCGGIALALFARSVGGLVLGMLSALASLEMLAALSRKERSALRWYGLFMMLIAGAAVLLGALVLSGVQQSCASAYNVDACTNLDEVVGITLSVGSSSLGILAAASAWLAFVGWPREPPTPAALLAASEAEPAPADDPPGLSPALRRLAHSGSDFAAALADGKLG